VPANTPVVFDVKLLYVPGGRCGSRTWCVCCSIATKSSHGASWPMVSMSWQGVFAADFTAIISCCLDGQQNDESHYVVDSSK